MDRRRIACKETEFNDRRRIACELEIERDAATKQVELQAVEDSRAFEAQRKKDLEQQRIEVQKRHREEKMKKRSVNIEIASGLMDLVMDLADETYDISQQSENKRISKSDWREFLQIFKDGKRVSMRNVKPQQQLEGATRTSALAINKDALAHDLLKEYIQEPALH